MLNEANFLVHYDTNKPVVLACDLPPCALGAVLSHMLDGSELPISFVLRTSKSQQIKFPNWKRGSCCSFCSQKVSPMFMVDISQYKLTINLYLGLLPKEKGIPPKGSAKIHWWVVTFSAYCYTVNYHAWSENKNVLYIWKHLTAHMFGDLEWTSLLKKKSNIVILARCTRKCQLLHQHIPGKIQNYHGLECI